MIRLQEPELRSTEDHSAWQATWNDDERLLAHCPPGYWYSLVNIAMVKRVLQGEMPPDLRLRFLEILHKQVHDNLTVEAMQRVEPACGTAMKMLDEMKPLSVNDKCKLMCKWNVIAAFINLNPSILEAMKLFRHPSSERTEGSMIASGALRFRS
jgi:hypothetical protein